MPLLDGGALRPDPFATIGDDDALPEGAALVSLARLTRDGEALAGRNAPLGVALPPDAHPDTLRPWLPRLALVALSLPKHRDGRAFTQARALREYHGYTGEIRATGHVIPDQYAALLRCGVSSIEVPADTDARTWTRMRDIIPLAYQPSQSGDGPPDLLRRRVGLRG
ncbi:DUF934 domain-containing protein [Roseomonas stagni]|uniref:DUF934 domain-containing protein n=1 Tax=Falsiroseomonas algicola TaxID=2716930 RepID=A0A6M1LH92_9PROT|nr:DUF934 domain-containing protein [Falsiroseomonas algicola]NGM19601.1 DUF934 domain-containing protein [Falsiroseomonas algicola]